MPTRQPTHRFLLPVTALLLLSACGGGGADTVAPPPVVVNKPGPPASVTIVSGDAQTAPMGSLLPVKPSVLVKDAAGTALADIAVQFTVDSGGGTLSTTSATTGSNGVAVAGDWTLGAVVGAQVMSARVGTLTPVKFRAQALGPSIQTLFKDAALAASGGTLKYAKPGDPLDGFTVTVPAGAYPGGTQLTVIADSTIRAPLPTGFAQVGPAIVISNAQGYADSVMTLTMPMQVAADVAVAPFYYDAANNTLEGIPIVERTATSVTLATRHFSRDFMGMPEATNGTNALRSAMRLGFGDVKMVWARVPRAQLVGTFTTSFRPGIDNWEFVNRGEYIGPNGDCEGMSVSAMYYHFYHTLKGEPPLYHQFDLTLANVLDNVQGIRFAGSVQGDYADLYHHGVDQTQRLVDKGKALGTPVEDLTSTWILMTLKLSRHPVLLGIYGTIDGKSAGHAVVAYAATSTGSHTEVSFADPNFPTTGRTMVFESGQLTPVTLQLSSTSTAGSFDKAYALSVSAEIPLSKIASRYDEFTKQKAGADRYPAQYRIEYFDNLSNGWLTLPSTLQTTDENLEIRHICPSCPTKTLGGAPDEHRIAIWDAAGANEVSSNGFTANAAGTTTYYARLSAFTVTDPGKIGFVDAIPFTVKYKPFTIESSATLLHVGDVVTFTAVGDSLTTTGSTYTWTIDDGSAPVTGTSKTFTHTLTKLGVNAITATLKDATGKAVARATLNKAVLVHVSISPAPIFASPGKPITLTANVVGGILPSVAPNVTYVWEFEGPGGGATQETTGPTCVHTFAVAGSYTVSVGVHVKDYPVALGISDPVSVTVKVFPGAWRLTSFTLVSAAPRTSGFLPAWVTGWNVQELMLDRVATNPSDALIFLEDNELFNEHAVYFQIAPAGAGKDAIYYVYGSYFTLLARAAPIQFSHYTSSGTLMSGSIDGEGYTGNLNVILLNAIQAEKVGTRMTGTIRIGPYAFGGERVYAFVATLVTP